VKTFSTVVLFILLAIAALFGANYLGWFGYNYFAPKYAATQSLVFHHSPEYIHGKIAELESLESRYIVATPVQQAELRSVILDEFYAYKGPVPKNLQVFLYSIARTHTYNRTGD
jgi:hypothetical protein